VFDSESRGEGGRRENKEAGESQPKIHRIQCTSSRGHI
jgi:hypothetical protein